VALEGTSKGRRRLIAEREGQLGEPGSGEALGAAGRGLAPGTVASVVHDSSRAGVPSAGGQASLGDEHERAIVGRAHRTIQIRHRALVAVQRRTHHCCELAGKHAARGIRVERTRRRTEAQRRRSLNRGQPGFDGGAPVTLPALGEERPDGRRAHHDHRDRDEHELDGRHHGVAGGAAALARG